MCAYNDVNGPHPIPPGSVCTTETLLCAQVSQNPVCTAESILCAQVRRLLDSRMIHEDSPSSAFHFQLFFQYTPRKNQKETLPFSMAIKEERRLRKKLHHRRPQTVGGFKKCFGEQGQRHEIAATGLMKISAKSATDHFVYVYFVRLRLLCCNARCRKTTKEASDGGASIWFQTLEASSIGLSNWMC